MTPCLPPLVRLLFVPTPSPVPCFSSSSPYSCCTLREPVTRASTPCAFDRSCLHTSFALTLLQGESTLQPLFEPHPPTAGLGPCRNQAQPNPLACSNPDKGIKGGFWSQLPSQGEPEHLRTNLFLVNPPSEVGWQQTLMWSLNGCTLPFFGQSGWGTLPAESAPEVHPWTSKWSPGSWWQNGDTNHCHQGFLSDKHLGQLP